MNTAMPTDIELKRMEQAADWLIRLHDTSSDEALTADWLQWCEAHPQNLPAFQRAQAIWQAATPQQHLASNSVAGRAGRWAVAASTVCLLLGAFWIVEGLSPRKETQSYATPIAGRATSVLPDGSKVEVGASSRISTHYSSTQRAITVEAGEAYFSVAKEFSRPFVVTAGSMRITALGTAFNVKRGDGRIIVAVSEGKVSIKGQAPDANADSALEAGQQAVYVVPSKKMAITAIHVGDAASWRQGVLKYLHEPLELVVEDLSRYSTKRIVISDAAIASLPFTGTVLSSHIDEALHGFADVFPLEVVDRPDRIELKKK